MPTHTVACLKRLDERHSVMHGKQIRFRQGLCWGAQNTPSEPQVSQRCGTPFFYKITAHSPDICPHGQRRFTPTLCWNPEYASGVDVFRLYSKCRPTHRVTYVWKISTRGIQWCLESTEIRFRPGLRPRFRWSWRHSHSRLVRGTYAPNQHTTIQCNSCAFSNCRYSRIKRTSRNSWTMFAEVTTQL